MSDINFSTKAGSYQDTALVQKNASEVLLNLLAIQGHEDVLDLGCGPGNITRKIAALTDGKVVGTDIAEGMINEAIQANNQPTNPSYLVKDAEELGFQSEYDVIFCNSAFQWFLNPGKVLAGCRQALKPGGRIGIQAPATNLYCPNFIEAVEKVRQNEATREIYSHFKSPWLFLDSEEEYAKLFDK